MADILNRLSFRDYSPSPLVGRLQQGATDTSTLDPTSGSGDFERGFEQGVSGSAASMSAYAASALDKAGYHEAADAAMKAASRQNFRSQQWAPSVTDYGQVDDFSSFLRFGAGAAGQGVASTMPALAGSVYGRGLGTYMGLGAKATSALSFGAGAAAMLPQEGGETVLQAMQDPNLGVRRPGEVFGEATTKGVINAAGENVVPWLTTKRMFGHGIPAGGGLGGVAKRVGGAVVEGTLAEAATEGAQEYVGQRVQNQLYEDRGLVRDGSQDAHQIANAAAMGAFGGGVMSGTGQAVGELGRLPRSVVESARNALPEKLPEVSGVDDFITKLRTSSPEQLGEMAGDALQSGVAAGVEGAKKIPGYVSKGVELAENEIADAKDMIDNSLGRSDLSEDNKRWLLGMSIKAERITRGQYNALKQVFYADDARSAAIRGGVAAGTTAANATKGAIALGSSLKQVITGFTKSFTKDRKLMASPLGSPDSLGSLKETMATAHETSPLGRLKSLVPPKQLPLLLQAIQMAKDNARRNEPVGVRKRGEDAVTYQDLFARLDLEIRNLSIQQAERVEGAKTPFKKGAYESFGLQDVIDQINAVSDAKIGDKVEMRGVSSMDPDALATSMATTMAGDIEDRRAEADDTDESTKAAASSFDEALSKIDAGELDKPLDAPLTKQHIQETLQVKKLATKDYKNSWMPTTFSAEWEGKDGETKKVPPKAFFKLFKAIAENLEISEDGGRKRVRSEEDYADEDVRVTTDGGAVLPISPMSLVQMAMQSKNREAALALMPKKADQHPTVRRGEVFSSLFGQLITRGVSLDVDDVAKAMAAAGHEKEAQSLLADFDGVKDRSIKMNISLPEGYELPHSLTIGYRDPVTDAEKEKYKGGKKVPVSLGEYSNLAKKYAGDLEKDQDRLDALKYWENEGPDALYKAAGNGDYWAATFSQAILRRTAKELEPEKVDVEDMDAVAAWAKRKLLSHSEKAAKFEKVRAAQFTKYFNEQTEKYADRIASAKASKVYYAVREEVEKESDGNTTLIDDVLSLMEDKEGVVPSRLVEQDTLERARDFFKANGLDRLTDDEMERSGLVDQLEQLRAETTARSRTSPQYGGVYERSRGMDEVDVDSEQTIVKGDAFTRKLDEERDVDSAKYRGSVARFLSDEKEAGQWDDAHPWVVYVYHEESDGPRGAVSDSFATKEEALSAFQINPETAAGTKLDGPVSIGKSWAATDAGEELEALLKRRKEELPFYEAEVAERKHDLAEAARGGKKAEIEALKDKLDEAKEHLRSQKMIIRMYEGQLLRHPRAVILNAPEAIAARRQTAESPDYGQEKTTTAPVPKDDSIKFVGPIKPADGKQPPATGVRMRGWTRKHKERMAALAARGETAPVQTEKEEAADTTPKIHKRTVVQAFGYKQDAQQGPQKTERSVVTKERNPLRSAEEVEAVIAGALARRNGGEVAETKTGVVVTESNSFGYRDRTKHNADSAGATVAIAVDFTTAGERLTKDVAGSKYLAIGLNEKAEDAAEKLIAHMRKLGTTTLNVAGNGIYTLTAKVKGITQEKVNQLVYDILHRVHASVGLTKIVSGGQTGVDIAGAVSARVLDVPAVITLPKGYVQRDASKVDAPHTKAEIEKQIEDGAENIRAALAAEKPALAPEKKKRSVVKKAKKEKIGPKIGDTLTDGHSELTISKVLDIIRGETFVAVKSTHDGRFTVVHYPSAGAATGWHTRRTDAIDAATKALNAVPEERWAPMVQHAMDAYKKRTAPEAAEPTENVKSEAENGKAAPTKRLPMYFKDKLNGLSMRPEFKGKSTLELIKIGERTATTRKSKPEYKVGDVIRAEGENGDFVDIRVTVAPYQLQAGEKNAAEWSALEGWDAKHFPNYIGWWQFQYTLASNKEATETSAQKAMKEEPSPSAQEKKEEPSTSAQGPKNSFAIDTSLIGSPEEDASGLTPEEETKAKRIVGRILSGDATLAEVHELSGFGKRSTDPTDKAMLPVLDAYREFYENIDKYPEGNKHVQNTVNTWSAKWAGGEKVKVIHVPHDLVVKLTNLTGENVGGMYAKVMGKHYIVSTKNAKSVVGSLSLLAHEFGHALERIAYEKASPEVKAAMQKAYQAALTKSAKDRNVADMIGPARFAENMFTSMDEGTRSQLTPGIGLKLAEIYGKELFNSPQLNYLTSFTEWFAEQFSRLATSETEQYYSEMPKETRSFWKELIATFKNFFDTVIKPLKADATFAGWVKSLAPEKAAPAKRERPFRPGYEVPAGTTPTSDSTLAADEGRGTDDVHKQIMEERIEKNFPTIESLRNGIARKQAGIEAREEGLRNFMSQTPVNADAFELAVSNLRAVLDNMHDELRAMKSKLRYMEAHKAGKTPETKPSEPKAPKAPEAAPPAPPSGPPNKPPPVDNNPSPTEPPDNNDPPSDAQKKILALVEKLFGKRVAVVFAKEMEAGVSGEFNKRDKLMAEHEGKSKEKKLDDIRQARRRAIDKYKTSENEKEREDAREAINRAFKQEALVLSNNKALGVITVAANLNNPNAINHESLHAAFEVLFTQEERRVLGTAFTKGILGQKLRAMFADDPVALAQINGDPEEAVAYGFQAYMANPDAFKGGPEAKTLLHRLMTFLRGLFHIMTEEMKVDAIFSDLVSGRRAETDQSPLPGRVGPGAGFWEKSRQFAEDLGGALMSAFNFLLETSYTRLEKTDNPALMKLAALGYTATGEGGELGMIQRQRIETRQKVNLLHKLLKDIPEKDIKAIRETLVLGGASSNPAVTAIRSFLRDMYAYQKEAGTGIGDLGKNYFPLVWDAEKVQKDKAAFIAMLNKPEYAEKIETLKKTPNEIAEGIIGEIERGEDFMSVVGRDDEPVSQSHKHRSLGFLSPEDRLPFVKDSLHEMLTFYTMQAVRKAEFNRAYGPGGAILNKLRMEAVERYGATQEQMTLAKDYIDGLMGNREVGMSRELKDTFGAAIVYQNFRLLPLNLFSSLVDPLGVAVRSNDITDAWRTYGYAMKNLFRDLKAERPDAGKDYWEKLAEDWGVIEDAGIGSNIHNMYESVSLRGTVRDANNALFKYNLLNGFVRNIKIMATASAGRFMVRLQDGTFDKATTLRYLEELNLEHSDLVYVPKEKRIANTAAELIAMGKSEVEAKRIEAKIRDATAKFVEQAVLDPSAAEKPVWGSNPYLAPIFHLKSFVFSFQKVIIDRMFHEAEHGNYKPLMVGAAYVPVMMAADFTRGLISGWGDEPPWKAGWTLGDHIAYGVQRSGLMGIGSFFNDATEDMMHGGQGYESALGPMVQQIGKGFKAATAGGDAAMHDFIVKALPGQTLFSTQLTTNHGGATHPGQEGLVGAIIGLGDDIALNPRLLKSLGKL